MTTTQPIGTRRHLLLGIFAAGLLALVMLGLRPGQLIPSSGGLRIFTEFFSAALTPAIGYESTVPAGTRPLLLKVLDASLVTLRFAATATSLSLVLGAILTLQKRATEAKAHLAAAERFRDTLAGAGLGA